MSNDGINLSAAAGWWLILRSAFAAAGYAER